MNPPQTFASVTFAVVPLAPVNPVGKVEQQGEGDQRDGYWEGPHRDQLGRGEG